MSLPSVLTGLPGIADAVPALGVLAQQNIDGGGGGILAGGAMMIVSLLIGLLALGLFVYALVDAIKNPNLSDTERIVWILVILFVGCLGPILYLLIAKNKGPRTRPPGTL